MLLKDLLKVIYDDIQNIVLFCCDEWIGTFPCCFVPSEYDKFYVLSITPDKFNGDYFGSGLVLKIWIEEGKELDNKKVVWYNIDNERGIKYAINRYNRTYVKWWL